MSGYFLKGQGMQDQEIAAAIAKAAPPVAVVGTTIIFGLTLNEWVAIATLFYIILQAFFLIKDRLKKRRDRRGRE